MSVKPLGSHREGPFTLEALHYYLHYDPETGLFHRKVNGEIRPEDASRQMTGRPYRLVQFRGRSYYAHRLAWIYVHGEWPPLYLDHVNRDGSDNRLCNLRLADTFENMMNRESSVKSSAGFKGVKWRRDMNKFCATIQHQNKKYHLGYFETAEEASEAYINAALHLRGEFANLK